MGMRIIKSLEVMKLKQVNLSSIAMQSRLGKERERDSFYVRKSVTSGPRRLVHGGSGQEEKDKMRQEDDAVGGLVTVMARGGLAKQEMGSLDRNI